MKQKKKKTSTPKKNKKEGKTKENKPISLAKNTTIFFPFLYPCKNPLT